MFVWLYLPKPNTGQSQFSSFYQHMMLIFLHYWRSCKKIGGVMWRIDFKGTPSFKSYWRKTQVLHFRLVFGPQGVRIWGWKRGQNCEKVSPLLVSPTNYTPCNKFQPICPNLQPMVVHWWGYMCTTSCFQFTVLVAGIQTSKHNTCCWKDMDVCYKHANFHGLDQNTWRGIYMWCWACHALAIHLSHYVKPNFFLHVWKAS